MSICKSLYDNTYGNQKKICSLLPYHLATAPYLYFTGGTAMYRHHPASGSNRPPSRMCWIDDICLNRYISSMSAFPAVRQTPAVSPPSATPALTVHALRTAAAHVERALAWALEPFSVTTAQYELLQVIERHGNSGAGCSELGKHLAAPGPDVTRMLDRLDNAGLVARNRDQNDRRVVRTVLTEKGEALLRAAAPVVKEAELAVFEGLADSERAQLALLLQGVRRNCPGN